LQNYIVRIYRHDGRKLREFVGIVEEVGEEWKRAFTNLDELWEILGPKGKRQRGEATAGKKGGRESERTEEGKPKNPGKRNFQKITMRRRKEK
jgi:hypothetical protein